ncbi:aspartate kinase [Clostridium sp.]|uniref:aspartate kinase n=1 Tax=Clostridium sp. TaxID=1506 RepID=UPI0025BA690C|nr:aspartate kinase [Clostridium sp.]MCI9070565.1 aspartate kinase [Clostridium sp.]
METIVTKFGGSSLADSSHFKKVKKIIENNSNRKFVIPSAPGKRFSKDFKITDLLYLCHAHVNSSIPLDDVFQLISDRYNSIVSELNLNLNLDYYLNIIKTDIENGASEDYTASRGEYLNGIILANYLDIDFIDAKDVIKFNKFGSLNINETYSLLKDKLSQHKCAVIPGFYGSDENGEIVTFSRGGSDITGALVAASINAKLYENWTDVSGFLMADPRIVNNPKKIKTITYGELRELSYMGASVLHEEAVFPVKNSGIPINIRNTNEPENEGTLIVKNETKHENTITGIAGKQNFTVLSIEKSMMNSELGFCRKVLTVLEQHGVSFENMPSGIDSVSVVISDSNLKNKTEIIVEEIKRCCNPDSVVVYPNMALIATVGNGMAYSKGVAAKIFTALAEANINIRMIDQGSSEINVLVGIENDDFEKGINAIYNAFN